VEKEKALRYSFLLSIPAIIGATVTESMRVNMDNIDVAVMFLGVVTSMIVGYVSLKLLLKVVLKEKFHLFGYYCWTVGAIIIFSQVLQPV
jgi:undecaprenyl-diphosphatase